MSVYIRGLNLPAEPMILILHPDGNISTEDYEIGANAKAIELPPHGRLIDADALKDTLDYYIREAGWSDEINEALTWVRDEFIDHEPTVIEAEGVSE